MTQSTQETISLQPLEDSQKILSGIDLFLIFSGANIVTTTIVTGGALANFLDFHSAFWVIVIGAILGTLPTACLAIVGPRYSVPTMIAIRSALGIRGTVIVTVIFYLANFAWIALNNVIASGAIAAVFRTGPLASIPFWAIILGVVSTWIVALGAKAMKLTDRLAVPLLLAVGAMITYALFSHVKLPVKMVSYRVFPWVLDIVVGYQISWALMFADYSRFVRRERSASWGTFWGLTLTSMWLMAIGAGAAIATGSADPSHMLIGLGFGIPTLIMMAVATITTNFVNIYLSAISFKTVFPKSNDLISIWSIGLIGTFFGVFNRGWLDWYARFMLVIGSLFIPLVGILLVEFFFGARRRPLVVSELYKSRGVYFFQGGFNISAVVCLCFGTLVYWTIHQSSLARVGSTLPTLIATMIVYAWRIREKT